MKTPGRLETSQIWYLGAVCSPNAQHHDWYLEHEEMVSHWLIEMTSSPWKTILSLKILLSIFTAVFFVRLWKRHTNEEGGLLDIMMLVAIMYQLRNYIVRTIIGEYLRIPMPPGSSIADNGKSMGYLSHLLTKPLRLCPWATLAIMRKRRRRGSTFICLPGGHRKRSHHACLASESPVSVQLCCLAYLLLVLGT